MKKTQLLDSRLIQSVLFRSQNNSTTYTEFRWHSLYFVLPQTLKHPTEFYSEWYSLLFYLSLSLCVSIYACAPIYSFHHIFFPFRFYKHKVIWIWLVHMCVLFGVRVFRRPCVSMSWFEYKYIIFWCYMCTRIIAKCAFNTKANQSSSICCHHHYTSIVYIVILVWL